MKGPLREIKPGEIFYLHREKKHYVGVLTTGDEPVHVYRTWSTYERGWIYTAVPQWRWEQILAYLTKSKPKRKLIY